MASEFKYVKVLGLLAGMLLGIGLGLSIGVYEIVRGRLHGAQAEIRALGLFNGSIHHLLPFLPLALLTAFFCAAGGYNLGHSFEECSKRKSERQALHEPKSTDGIWPPPPTPQKKDDP